MLKKPTATHYNTLQHTATFSSVAIVYGTLISKLTFEKFRIETA